MGMDMLAQLLGGGQNRQQNQDFVNRYDTGAPWDGISDHKTRDVRDLLLGIREHSPDIVHGQVRVRAEQLVSEGEP